MSQRIASMVESILSRSQLQDMIQGLNLYPRKRKRVPMEDIIEDMKTKYIRINPVFTLRARNSRDRTSSAFRIEFSYQDRYLAQKVTKELVTRLIDMGLSTRFDQSVQTTQFLQDQLDDAKVDLDAIEQRLTDYKLRNAGRLPTQLNSNLAQLRTLQAQLGAVGSAISRVNQDKISLESQLKIFREELHSLSGTPEARVAAASNERLLQLERQIVRWETMLSGLRQQYKETHPDVRRTEAQLAASKRDRDELLKEEQQRVTASSEPKAAPVVVSPQSRRLESSIQKLESLLQAKDKQLEEYVETQARIDEAMKEYQKRIEAGPYSEHEYVQLTRDYDMAKRKYSEMSLKQSQSALATDLENRMQGEKLELLNDASLPEKPSEPQRWVIICVGTSFGLMLGFFLAGGREVKDTSLKNLKDVRAYTGLTVLGSVPLLENDLVVRRKRRLTWLAWSSGCIVGLLIMLGSVYYYYASNT
jgi:uncharacterized protein involved in exopolysaccharide biosynthesis